ncbi:MAG: hypothetical protein HY882_08355 [Deltaproteobacteria bacterium]|nr:hypothetical protein [Deltaproteobacteria bacterium]
MRGGWLDRGDLARMDVGKAIASHPAVKEVAVIRVPENRWGESVKALVVLREGKNATEEEIIVFCKENLASYKKPRYVRFVSSLPKNPGGKNRRERIETPISKKAGPVSSRGDPKGRKGETH